ncbi:MAG TPA: membrane protein insertase YidC [Longimicrobiales bacterium]
MNQSFRFILAVLLMVAVVVITNIVFPPAPRGQQNAVADSSAVVTNPPPTPATQTPAAATPAQPTRAATRSDTVVVESPLYRFAFSTEGAALVSAEMLRFKSYTRDGVVQLAGRTPGGLVSHDLRISGQIVDLGQIPFTPSQHRIVLNDASGPQILRFTHNSAQYGNIELQYTFVPNDYLVRVNVVARGPSPAQSLYVNLGPTLATNEAKPQEDQHALGYVVNSHDRGIESMPLRSLKANRIEEGPLDWVALKSKYFVAAAVVDSANGAKPFGGLNAVDVPARYAAKLTATLPPSADGVFSYRLFLGPQDYKRLLAVGSKLQDVNPVGWRVFRPILRPLAALITWLLITIHGALGISYGWVLILFGILIRLAMWPLNAKAMRSQMKSMELQPRLKDIQTRHKNDPQKLQQEMMKLYKEEGFNPMGGCLPMLIPMPVLITLFFVFQNFIEFRGVPFLWLPDLSRADPLYILPLLLGATIFVQQVISMKTMPPNPQMKFMLYFMPLFMIVIFLNLASGLNLYYAAQNLPGFIQQMQLSKERARYQAERGVASASTPAEPAKSKQQAGTRRKR